MSTEPAAGVELVLDGELLDPGIPVPAPGDGLSVSVMRYAVLAVVQGSYPHDVVLVAHDPWQDVSGFTAGARHRLHLSRELPADASLVNPFAAEAPRLGVYFCPRFEELTAT